MATKSRYVAYVENMRGHRDLKRANVIVKKVSVMKRLKELKGQKS